MYLDGARGHYINHDLIEFAHAEGFPVDPFAEFVLNEYGDRYHEDLYPNDAVFALGEDAINWLNENQPLDGHYWEFNDGDFGLWADDLADKD